MAAPEPLFSQKDVVSVEMDEKYLKIIHGRGVAGNVKILKAKTMYAEAISDDEAAEEIKKFTEAQNLRQADIISVIPSRFGIYKNIEIPSIDTNEIKQIIDLQAGAHTPYPKNEIIIDYMHVSVFHERYTKILLVILKRDVVTKRYDVIKKAGFKADKAVLAPEFASKLFHELCPDRDNVLPIGIVHTDINSTDFTVIEKRKVSYIRSIASGMKDLAGGSEDGKMAFIEELKKSLEAYQTSNIGEGPARIYFTGGTDGMSDIIPDIGTAIEKEIEILPYDRLGGTTAAAANVTDGDPAISILSPIAPLLAESGAYLDLVPEDVRMRRYIKKKSRDATKMGILAIVALLLFCIALLTNVFLKSMYLNKLEGGYTKENKEVEKLGEVTDRTGMIKRFLGRKGKGLTAMSELFNSMPDEVYLSSIDFKNSDTFTFTGTADSMSRVFSLVTSLEGNQFFKNVKVDFTKSRRQKNQEVADFGLTLLLE